MRSRSCVCDMWVGFCGSPCVCLEVGGAVRLHHGILGRVKPLGLKGCLFKRHQQQVWLVCSTVASTPGHAWVQEIPYFGNNSCCFSVVWAAFSVVGFFQFFLIVYERDICKMTSCFSVGNDLWLWWEGFLGVAVDGKADKLLVGKVQKTSSIWGLLWAENSYFLYLLPHLGEEG